MREEWIRAAYSTACVAAWEDVRLYPWLRLVLIESGNA